MSATKSESRPSLILAVMCSSVFLVVVDNTIVNVALPSMAHALRASNAGLQWIVDGYALPFAGLLLAGGALSDRWGRKRVMLGGLFCFGLFSTFAAFSSSTSTLIASRAFMGVAAAFIFPATLSVLTVTFTDARQRAKAFGVWGATSGVAVAFGPLGGGALIAHFWFGSIFLVNVPIVLFTMVATARLVPESTSPVRQPFDPVGLLLGTAGVTTLVLAIIEGPTWGWLSATTLTVFALAAALVVSFVSYELRRSAPQLDVRVFRVRAFSSSAVAIAITFFGLFGFIFLMTQYFQLVRGYSALSAGVHTLPFAIVSMVVTPLGAIAALRWGTRRVVTTGLIVMSIALAWMGVQSATAPYVGPVLLSMVVMAFGFSLITAPSTAAVMSSLRPEQIGAGAAVNNTTRELGGALGVAVMGSVFSSKFAVGIAALHFLRPAQFATARSSMQAALETVHVLPTTLQPAAHVGVTAAFLSGFHGACVVAAAVILVIAALLTGYLPERAPRADATSVLVGAQH